MPALLARQPARQESVREVSSAWVTLERLRESIPGFAVAVDAVLRAGWQPRVTAVTELAVQARQLLETAGGGLANRGQRLARELEAAERNLSGQLPDLLASAQEAELEAVGRALASVTAVETAVSSVVAEVGDVLASRVAVAKDLAEATMRALLPHIPAEDAGLGTALGTALANMPDAPAMPALPPATAEQIDAVGLGLTRLSALESATAHLLTTATAAHDALRPSADTVLRTVAVVRGVLTHAGDHSDRLGQRLTVVTERLVGATPAWWPGNGTALATVPQVEAAGLVLAAGPAELSDAVRDVARVIGEVFRAAAPGWEPTVASLRAAVSDLRDLLPYVGQRQADLGAVVRLALARVDAVTPDMWALMARGRGPHRNWKLS